MKNALSHSVLFARSLALATTLVACSGSDEPAPSPPEGPAPTATTTATAAPAPSTPPPADTTAPVKDEQANNDAGDAPLSDAGHVSGPLPPPELPGSFV